MDTLFEFDETCISTSNERINRMYNGDINKILWTETYSKIFEKHKDFFKIQRESFIIQRESFIIQTVQMEINQNVKDIADFFYSNFDFDICKNVFYYDDTGFHVEMTMWCRFFKKETEYKVSDYVGKTPQRYKKYANRGFKFINLKPHVYIHNACIVI